MLQPAAATAPVVTAMIAFYTLSPGGRRNRIGERPQLHDGPVLGAHAVASKRRRHGSGSADGTWNSVPPSRPSNISSIASATGSSSPTLWQSATAIEPLIRVCSIDVLEAKQGQRARAGNPLLRPSGKALRRHRDAPHTVRHWDGTGRS